MTVHAATARSGASRATSTQRPQPSKPAEISKPPPRTAQAGRDRDTFEAAAVLDIRSGRGASEASVQGAWQPQHFVAGNYTDLGRASTGQIPHPIQDEAGFRAAVA